MIFAVSITALLAVGALVLGGSTGYTAVRNAQNAADAASLAATGTLRQVGQGLADSTEVLSTAQSVAADNGATGDIECDIVNANYALSQAESDVIGPCDEYNAELQLVEGIQRKNELMPGAAGVRVQTGDTRDVPFSAFVDRETIRGVAVAAATMQPVRGGMRAPFMVCAAADDHGVPLVVEDDTLDPPYRVNQGALDVEFLLWSNGNGFGDRNCGESSWHGLVDNSANIVYQIPSDPDDPNGWWAADPGSEVGHIPNLLAAPDACAWETDSDMFNSSDCLLALPLCVALTGEGQNAKLNCVRMATFRITYVGYGEDEGSCVSTNKDVVCGKLVEGGIATGGQGTTDPIDPHEMLAIKLVE